MSLYMRLLTCLSLSLTLSCGQQEEAAQVEETKQMNPMQEFGTTAGNVFLYYEDLDRATKFN